jgi:hypothetical protein
VRLPLIDPLLAVVALVSWHIGLCVQSSSGGTRPRVLQS